MKKLLQTVLGREQKSHVRLVAMLSTLFCSLFFVPHQFLASNDEVDLAIEVQQSPHSRPFASDRVVPRWLGDSEKFWYRVLLPDGSFEFILVDPELPSRELAFDHLVVNEFIRTAKEQRTGDEPRDSTQPLDRVERLTLDPQTNSLMLIGQRHVYLWDAQKNAVTLDPRSPSDFRESYNGNISSQQSGEETSLQIENRTEEPVELFWVSGANSRKSYGIIEPGEAKQQHTFGGHRWHLADKKGKVIRRLVANDFGLLIVLESLDSDLNDSEPANNQTHPKASLRDTQRDARRRGARGTQMHGDAQDSTLSPDQRWRYEVSNGSLWCIALQGQKSIQLEESSPGLEWIPINWLKNTNQLVVFKKNLVEKAPIHILRSSPPGGGRAVLESIPYSLPGDAFPTYELRIYSLNTDTVPSIAAQQNTNIKIIPEIDPFEHEWLQPQVKFLEDGESFCYELIDRGHQRHRLVRVNGRTGEVHAILDERSNTFLWTAHTDSQAPPRITWIANEREIVHATERDGWRQLFLVDANSGEVVRELTPQGIVVRSIERIDDESRSLWFTACGAAGRDGLSDDQRNRQDPYHIHYGRVSLDTGEIVWLTSGNGTHSVVYSPSNRYIIDTYSRVDLPPVTEVRDSKTGESVIQLESTNLKNWQSTGGSTEEVFVAKGRDGVTDIWGIICRPSQLEPGRKYPVVEDIYAGPHGSFVPKNFSPTKRYQELTDLGFIVVKIDGMGTANRSKAFQDVCWQNLKDGGFADRILWMKAAAEKYKEFDLTRVGIFGVSAGGQNAAAALLHHGDFYKVGVAGCGCHDNRMDKASWNEQWMGYPVGKQYSVSSNIDNAHLLKGKLLLIVGEVDTNVPPESTLRFADALIRHDKDFELLVVPNEGHGIGGAYGEKRKVQFLAKHLLANPFAMPLSASD